MKKKVLVTRKLLRSNEERASKLWDAKLNLNDEVYSQQKIIELSQGCDGILSSLTEKIDEKVINSLPHLLKLFLILQLDLEILIIKQQKKEIS